MSERNSYDADTKAAVMAALLTGQAVSKVAEEYDIPEGTVKGWKSKAKEALGADVPTQKKEEIGALLLEYVRENLQTLQEQTVGTFRNTKWLEQQTAADLAVLHGVLTDKTVRLLEAMAGAE